ncbi:MAG TPA: hypothetical protein VIV12_23605 [Streptosporangiaceae bacterium]
MALREGVVEPHRALPPGLLDRSGASVSALAAQFRQRQPAPYG